MVQVDIGVGQDELQVILLFSPLLSRKPPPLTRSGCSTTFQIRTSGGWDGCAVQRGEGKTSQGLMRLPGMGE